jgi:abortive infection bacteriophage resistance protein
VRWFCGELLVYENWQILMNESAFHFCGRWILTTTVFHFPKSTSTGGIFDFFRVCTKISYRKLIATINIDSDNLRSHYLFSSNLTSNFCSNNLVINSPIEASAVHNRVYQNINTQKIVFPILNTKMIQPNTLVGTNKCRSCRTVCALENSNS